MSAFLYLIGAVVFCAYISVCLVLVRGMFR